MKLIIKPIEYIYGKLNALRLHRQRLWLKLQGIELGKNVYLGKHIDIQRAANSQLKIGNNVTILDYTRICANPGSYIEIGADTFIGHHCEIASSERITIGEKCALAAYCTVIDTDKDYTDLLTPMPVRKAITSPIELVENVWLAYKVTVLRGVSIDRGAVVGANAVVTKNIPAYCVATGIPAKVIKQFPGSGERELLLTTHLS
jgi:acetyltransferase-like isoleucine patch superfamily enzyme